MDSLLKYVYMCFIYLKYLIKGNFIRVKPTAIFYVSNSAILRNVKIFVAPGAQLKIGEDVVMQNTIICVERGSCIIDDNCIVGPMLKDVGKTKIIINDGSLKLNHHARLTLDRIWIRFGGKVNVGCYTNINNESEIRCDESVHIGDYDQISYGVKIWDTNTHTILDKSERRRITEKYFPYFGYEISKPKTAPIFIGNDCWIGENASILKGTKLGDEVIVGYNTLLSGHEIEDCSTVVAQTILKINKRQ